MFTSRGNTGSSIDDIGESQLDDLAACEAMLGKSASDHADPAWLIPVGVAGAVLAPAREPGLTNGE